MPEETLARRSDIVILASGAVTLLVTGLSLLIFWDGTPTTALPLAGSMTMPVIPTGRGWDLLVAPIWAMILVRYSVDRRRDVYTAALPVLGLISGIGIYLLLWGRVGVIPACLTPIVAITMGRIMNLFDDAEHRRIGGRADPFNAGAAVYACVAFGLGSLTPFAVAHGFLLTFMIPFMGYLLVSFLLCAVLFGALGALRLVAEVAKAMAERP